MLLIHKLELDGVNVDRVILVLGGLLLYSILPWSAFSTSLAGYEAMLMLLVLHSWYELKEVHMFTSKVIVLSKFSVVGVWLKPYFHNEQ